jgi:hypothetical protein
MRAVITLPVAVVISLLVGGPVAAQVESNEPPFVDSAAARTFATAAPPVMDFAMLVRGTGHHQDRGAGNSSQSLLTPSPCGPCLPVNGNGILTIGPAAVNTFAWQINDAGPSVTFPTAPGKGGPAPDSNNQVSGWSQLQSLATTNGITHMTTPGNLIWTATSSPGSQFQLSLETLLGPETTVGTSPDGPMSDFDPTQTYRWPLITYQGTYTGPTNAATLTADTLIDSSLFANAIPPTARFSIAFGGASGTAPEIDLIYSPVPEPGTLSLVAVGLLGVWRRYRRMGR